MHFGTYMGVYWILKFILFPLGFTIPFLSFLYIGLTLGVPFIGYHYAKMYRNKICGGFISFAHACLFTLFMYMFASLLVSLVHYVYFRFIDHGFIMGQYAEMIQQVSTAFPGMENEKEILQNALDSIQTLSPIDITMQILSSDVFFGSILAVPTALFVMKRRRQIPTETAESPQE